MKTIKKFFIRIMLVGIISMLSLLGFSAWQTLGGAVNLADKQRIIFTIMPGSSKNEVLSDLQQQAIITETFWLKVYLKLLPKSHSFKIGEYAITKDMSTIELLRIFEQGKSIQHTIRFIEGWNINKLIAAVNSSFKPQQKLSVAALAAKMPKIHQRALEKLEKDGISAKKLAVLAQLHATKAISYPEGMFFPDTYAYTKFDSMDDVLLKAHAKLLQSLADAWLKKSKKSLLKTPYEALIMASIIEKETAVAKERQLISGVFNNRIAKKMRLQTDPTVIYGMGDAYQGKIRYKDLRTDTPYNTYTRHGLPPTPIAIVGKAAIYAAVKPAKTAAIFFVSRNDGTHVFSDNLQDHEQAVDEFQRKRRKKNQTKSGQK